MAGRPGDKPLLGVVMMLASLLLMAVLSALVKSVSAREPLAEVLFFRFAGSLIPLAWMLRRSGGISLLRTDQPLEHALRSLFGIMGIATYFYALSAIPIADATALTYSAPLFIMLFSIVFLGERVGAAKWLSALIGFVGVFLIASPRGHGVSMGTLAAVASAVFGALVSVWIRRLSQADGALTIAIIYNATGAAVSMLGLLIIGWELDLNIDLAMMVTVGLIAGAQQFLMTSSFRYAEASVIAPLEYALLVFAGLIGWLFWDEVPTDNALIGAVIITVSGVFVVRLGRARA
ncbi:MAG: DMT family transporter [Proteobacteria bacterium]|nr:MAG: DMT family transporter [Pseudomonadota bacterium]